MALANVAAGNLWRPEHQSSHVLRYVLIGIAILVVAAFIRMVPELRRYLKMRAM